jgi:hypothetical protein
MDEIKNHQVIAMIPEDLFKRFKHLSVESEKTIRALLIEAMNDLMVKYENSNINRE